MGVKGVGLAGALWGLGCGVSWGELHRLGLGLADGDDGGFVFLWIWARTVIQWGGFVVGVVRGLVSCRPKLWMAPVRAKKSRAGRDEDAEIEVGDAEGLEQAGAGHEGEFSRELGLIRSELSVSKDGFCRRPGRGCGRGRRGVRSWVRLAGV